MIGQKIGLQHLISIALERLESDPLAEGHCYRGDLLAAMISIDNSYWNARPKLAERVRETIRRVRASIPDLDEITSETIRWVFRNGNPSLM